MLADTVITPMLAYLEEVGEDGGFHEKDVRKCEKILLLYLESLEKLSIPSDKGILAAAKKAVLDLNKLNEKTDYALLETEERENICELIQNSAVEAGLTDPEEDITEEWREW
jgi:hypothetical protein